MVFEIPEYLQYMYSYPHKTAYRPFSPPLPLVPFFDTLTNTADASLYFHIPFCTMKCGFCNLFSRTRAPANLLDAYLVTLRRQAEQLSQLTGAIEFTSFAIGGGTPMLLDEAQVDALLASAACFGVSPEQVETSVETSPDHAQPAALQHLVARGIQRLSIGIQSFKAEELRRLRRPTPLEDCHAALENICKANFPKLNIDLIYGIEEQTPEDFLFSLNTALAYHPTELFLYPLYVRPGTPLRQRADAAVFQSIYIAARDLLTQHGFVQTSMRRFVRTPADHLDLEGASCGDEVMISCGCGGRSYIGDLHCATPYAVSARKIREIIDDYCVTDDFTCAHNGYILSQDEKQRRFIIKNLMYHQGIDIAEFARRFNADVFEYDLTGLLQGGLVVQQGNRLILTANGLAASDSIGQRFISPEVRAKKQSYHE